MRLFLASIACCLFFITCQKSSTDETLTPTPDGFNSMNGKIIWPVGIALDTTGIKVSTFHSAASIKENKFTVDTINKFSTVFVTDAKGDVKMMRYNYPQQKDNDISPNSTALALLMNAPIVNSLSDEGQVAMIIKIQLDPNFPLLEDEVKKAIASNKSVTDTNNTSLILATSKLFENVSRSRTNVYRAVPLKITTANPATFSFANNNVSHKYVIGVYKNNSRIQKLVVNGTQSFAGSFKDVLDGVFGNGYSSPDAKIYSNIEDGTLNFKIRSGAPGTGDNSKEYDEAFKENIVQYIFQLATKHMLFRNDKCTKIAYDGIASVIESTPSFANAKTPSDFATLALGFCSDMFNTRSDLFENCSHYKDPNYKNPFWKAAGKLFKFFDKVGKVGQGLNIGMHVYDLYNSRAVIDTCFTVSNKQVGKCAIATVVIGKQEWMNSNLNVSTYRNGDPIPEVKDYDTWFSMKTGAWCYYENESENGITHGKLYNVYAINDPRGLAPEGFHIPSLNEWKELQESVEILNKSLNRFEPYYMRAETLMSSAGWYYTPSFYTNKTGFSARPSGWRTQINGRDFNGFMSKGHRTYWQTSSILPPNGSIGERQAYVILDRWDPERIYGLNMLNGVSAAFFNIGVSVRCIKN